MGLAPSFSNTGLCGMTMLQRIDIYFSNYAETTILMTLRAAHVKKTEHQTYG